MDAAKVSSEYSGDEVREYHEKRSTSSAKKILCLAAIPCTIAFGVGAYFVFQEGWNADGVPFIIACTLAIALVVLTSACVGGYYVNLENQQLEIGFIRRIGCCSRTLLVEDIRTCEVVAIKWCEWGGFGYRIRSCKHVGYILENGPGVHLRLKDGRQITFSCIEPEKLVSILQKDLVPMIGTV